MPPPVTLREPEKELEPAPVERKSPEVETLPVPWMPLVVFKLPEKVLEPVLVEVNMPARVRVPEILAVPPTSRAVSVLFPALMPKRPLAEVSSEFPETEALTNEVRPVRVLVPETVRVVKAEVPVTV